MGDLMDGIAWKAGRCGGFGAGGGEGKVLAADRAVYVPGAVARVRVGTARDGTPVQSAVGVAVVDESVFALAGLWEHWQGEQEVFDSCAIITLPASGVMTTIHTRMPAIIATADYDAWLDTDVTDKADIMPKLASTMSGQLQAYAVGSYVNSPKHTDARCIEPL